MSSSKKGRTSPSFDLWETGEAGLVLPLVLLYFLLGCAYILTQTAAYALFIEAFGANRLPYTYIAIAMSGLVMGVAYLKLDESLPLIHTLYAVLAFVLGFSLLLWAALNILSIRALVFVLPVWSFLQINLGNTVVWAVFGQLLDVRQTKRLFGLVGAGRWAGAILAGLAIPWLISVLQMSGLFLVSAVLLGFACLVYRGILRHHAVRISAGSRTQDTASVAASARSRGVGLRGSAYLRTLFLLTFVWIVTVFFAEQIFYLEAEAYYADAEQLARFLGLFTALAACATLFSNLFLTGPVLQRFGLRAGLLMNPVLTVFGYLLFGIAAALGLAALRFPLSNLAFFFVLFTSFSFDIASFRVLYQPLPTAQRIRAAAISEIVVEPLTIGATGALLVGLGAIMGLGSALLTYVLLALLLFRSVISSSVLRNYLALLLGAVERRRFGFTDVELSPEAIELVVEHGLSSPFPEAVLYAVDLLAQQAPAQLAPAVPQLLDHPSPEIVCRVLEYAVDTGDPVHASAIRRLLGKHPIPAIYGPALHALVVLDAPNGLAHAKRSLDNPEQEVQRGAVLALLLSEDEGARAIAYDRLSQLAASPRVEERRLAAQIAGAWPQGSATGVLSDLLHDPYPAVGRAALEAAGALKQWEALPVLVQALDNIRLRPVASAALVAFGSECLPTLHVAWKQADAPVGRLVALAHICSRIGTPEAVTLLAQHLDASDGRVRRAVLEALAHCQYECASEEESARVSAQIQRELSMAGTLLAALDDVASQAPSGPLVQALQEEIHETRRRILLLASFLDQPARMFHVREAYFSPVHVQRAYALELIETVLPSDLKPLAMAFLDTLRGGNQRQRLSGVLMQPRIGYQARVQLLAAASDDAVSVWIRACARHTLGLAAKGDEPMLSLVERTMILKTVGIFSETASAVLAEVAPLLEEVEVVAGETIFEKGEIGRALYVIVSGRVRVHDGERVLNYLDARSVFGEMALLDPQPRMATVAAEQDTLLFKLEQEPFRHLLADQPEVASGIIRVLSSRLRSRADDVVALQARVAELERRLADCSQPTPEDM